MGARAIPPQIPRGNWLAGIGDSITANGVVSSSAAATSVSDRLHGRLDPRNWQMWASLYSNGRLIYAGTAATGGYTSTQVLATHLPTILAAPFKPHFCTVLCGTNDVPIGDATAKSNLLTMYRALAGSGIMPVLCTLTPRQDSKNSPTVVKLNQWIARTAAENGWPLCDLYAAVTDTDGGYFSGYVSDNVHPTSTGAKVMGQALATALTDYMPHVFQPLPVATASPISPGANALMLADANSDGRPDGWTLQGSSTTESLVNPTSSDVVGKWYKHVRGASTATSQSTGFTKVAGNVVRMVCRVKTVVEATGSLADIRVADNNLSGDIISLRNWDKDIPASTLILEGIVPTGLTGSNVTGDFSVATAANGEAYLGQFAAYDVTAQVL